MTTCAWRRDESSKGCARKGTVLEVRRTRFPYSSRLARGANCYIEPRTPYDNLLRKALMQTGRAPSNSPTCHGTRLPGGAYTAANLQHVAPRPRITLPWCCGPRAPPPAAARPPLPPAGTCASAAGPAGSACSDLLPAMPRPASLSSTNSSSPSCSAPSPLLQPVPVGGGMEGCCRGREACDPDLLPFCEHRVRGQCQCYGGHRKACGRVRGRWAGVECY